MAIKLFKRPLSPRLFLALPLILAACGVAEQQAERRVVRPVKTMVIGADETGGIRSFPARIESSRRADLSFRVPGKVVELLVREGERVEPGQVIAHLDPVTFQVVVDGRRATLDRITKDFERATDLLPRGVVPGQTYDRLEAEMKSATAGAPTGPARPRLHDLFGAIFRRDRPSLHRVFRGGAGKADDHQAARHFGASRMPQFDPLINGATHRPRT